MANCGKGDASGVNYDTHTSSGEKAEKLNNLNGGEGSDQDENVAITSKQ